MQGWEQRRGKEVRRGGRRRVERKGRERGGGGETSEGRIGRKT